MTRVATESNLVVTAEHDLASIRAGDWPDREFPLGPREKPTRRSVIFKQSVLNDVYAHGRGAPDVEVCGVLVGNVYRDAQGPFVFIEANIRGNFATGRAAQVTFTAKTWSHIQSVMDRHYPDKRILGWYHTHPGHGIFLSDMDLFIHKNFFSLPWHLALVFDPQQGEEGLFAWRHGQMAIESFVVQKDAPPPQVKVARRVPESMSPHPVASAGVLADKAGAAESTNGDAASAAQTATLPAAAGNAGGRTVAAARELADLSIRLQSLEKRQRWMTAGMALLVLIAVAWPIALSALAVMNAPQDLLPWSELEEKPPGAEKGGEAETIASDRGHPTESSSTDPGGAAPTMPVPTTGQDQ